MKITFKDNNKGIALEKGQIRSDNVGNIVLVSDVDNHTTTIVSLNTNILGYISDGDKNRILH